MYDSYGLDLGFGKNVESLTHKIHDPHFHLADKGCL